jgi:AAA domain
MSLPQTRAGREPPATTDAILAALRCGRDRCSCEAAGRRGRGLTHCPAHDDRAPSLNVTPAPGGGGPLVRCHAGCLQEAVLAALRARGLWADEGRPQGLKLAEYALAKRLDMRFLRELGLADADWYGQSAILMPYRDMRGRTVARRYRLALDKNGTDDRFRWERGAHVGLYGLERLDQLRPAGGLLVEGESDLQTCWQAGIPAVAVPGANNWREDRDAPLLADIAPLYVVREPDRGGEALVRALAASALHPHVRVLDLAPHKDVSELWLADPEHFRERIEQAKARAVGIDQATGVQPAREPLSVAELMALDLPEPRWAVDQLLPEGLALIGGRPKLGKSWLVLHLGLAVACGGYFLGTHPAHQGDVLLLALEDGHRRLQDRCRRLLGGREPPGNLFVENTWPAMDNGGLERLEGWLDQHPAARLVVIDTWAVVQPHKQAKGDLYAQDYAALRAVKALADRHHVAILLVLHFSKPKPTADADFLDDILGTTGLTGAADTVLGLRRESRGGAHAVLAFRGRDVEMGALALARDATLIFNNLGPAEEICLSVERREVVDAIRRAGHGLTPQELARALDEPSGVIRKRLHDMGNDGQVVRQQSGAYTLPCPNPDTSNASNAGNASNTGNGSNAPPVGSGVPDVTPVTGVTTVTASEGCRVCGKPFRTPNERHVGQHNDCAVVPR